MGRRARGAGRRHRGQAGGGAKLALAAVGSAENGERVFEGGERLWEEEVLWRNGGSVVRGLMGGGRGLLPAQRAIGGQRNVSVGAGGEGAAAAARVVGRAEAEAPMRSGADRRTILYAL